MSSARTVGGLDGIGPLPDRGDGRGVRLAAEAHGGVAPRVGGYIPELDGLRAVAILMVMAGHFLAVCKQDILSLHPVFGLLAFKVASWGGRGVDLFFVLSGFLITGILLDAKGQRRYFGNFYARRFLRIFPLYYTTLLVTLVLLPRLLPMGDAAFARILDNQQYLWLYLVNVPPFSHIGFYTPHLNYVHLWSLAVEEHFYLAWPLVVHLCTRRQLGVVGGALVLGSVAARSFMMTAGASGWTVTTFTPCRLDSLIIGGLVALTLRATNGAMLCTLARPAAIVTGALTLLVLLRRSGQLPNDLDSTILALFCASILVLAISGDRSSAWRRWLSSRPMRHVGRISYGLYVLHFLFLGTIAWLFPVAALSRMLHSTLLGIVCFQLLAFGISWCAAVASWYLLERPLLELKRHFAYAGRDSAVEVRVAGTRVPGSPGA